MRHNLKALKKLATSSQAAERLQSLRIMREQIEAGSRPERYLPLARPLIGDADNDCRWQALIVVGECVQSSPEAVWKVICEYGVSEDEDMSDGRQLYFRAGDNKKARSVLRPQPVSDN